MNQSILKIVLVLSVVSSVLFSSKPAHAEADFLLHGVFSYAIATVAYNIFSEESLMDDTKAKWAAFGTTMALGLLKEAIDGEFDADDVAANALGAGIGAYFAFKF